jgi:hypothetical protein
MNNKKDTHNERIAPSRKFSKLLKTLFALIVIIYCIPKCLSKAGVIKFTNSNPHHIKVLISIMSDSLNNDKILEGIKRCKEEFIFNFKSTGAWIKFIAFMLIITLALVIINYIISLLPDTFNIFKKAFEKAKQISYTVKSKLNALKQFTKSAECFLKYGVVPDYDNTTDAVICISTEIKGKSYMGGLKANKKFFKIHLISDDGCEKFLTIGTPVYIIKSKNDDIFICGNELEDRNDTKRRKIMLPRNCKDRAVDVKIGEYKFNFFVVR